MFRGVGRGWGWFERLKVGKKVRGWGKKGGRGWWRKIVLSVSTAVPRLVSTLHHARSPTSRSRRSSVGDMVQEKRGEVLIVGRTKWS